MATPSPVHASEALDELVNQFSDPLSFFRELIQNSLDAGSAEVEVRIDYEPGEGADGAMIIHVDDWGDGMDKEIIDKRLTRLFSSAFVATLPSTEPRSASTRRRPGRSTRSSW
jgi:sensor histidine kinase regulating citrate/malate metabolism